MSNACLEAIIGPKYGFLIKIPCMAKKTLLYFRSKPTTILNVPKIHKVVTFMKSHHSNYQEQEDYGLKLKI